MAIVNKISIEAKIRGAVDKKVKGIILDVANATVNYAQTTNPYPGSEYANSIVHSKLIRNGERWFVRIYSNLPKWKGGGSLHDVIVHGSGRFRDDGKGKGKPWVYWVDEPYTYTRKSSASMLSAWYGYESQPRQSHFVYTEGRKPDPYWGHVINYAHAMARHYSSLNYKRRKVEVR